MIEVIENPVNWAYEVWGGLKDELIDRVPHKRSRECGISNQKGKTCWDTLFFNFQIHGHTRGKVGDKRVKGRTRIYSFN